MDTFPKVLIEFTTLLVLSTSIDHYKKLKRSGFRAVIRRRAIKYAAGQDMVKLVEKTSAPTLRG
jgi:hypothetical protein